MPSCLKSGEEFTVWTNRAMLFAGMFRKITFSFLQIQKKKKEMTISQRLMTILSFFFCICFRSLSAWALCPCCWYCCWFVCLFFLLYLCMYSSYYWSSTQTPPKHALLDNVTPCGEWMTPMKTSILGNSRGFYSHSMVARSSRSVVLNGNIPHCCEGRKLKNIKV